MKFFILKVILGFIGTIMLGLFIFSFSNLIKLIYFSEENLISYFFDVAEICDENNNKLQDDLCINLATAHWMTLFSIISSILSFICLFPFFIMKKKL